MSSNKKVTKTKAENEEKDKEDNHLKDEEHFGDKLAALLPGGTREEAPLDKNVPSEWMRYDKIPRDYHNKKQKPQFRSGWTYL